MERIEERRAGWARFWRNPSVRRLVALYGCAAAAALLLLWALAAYSADRLARDWLERETETIGRLAEERPELADRLPRLLLEEPTDEQRERGRRIAAEHGLDAGLGAALVPLARGHAARTFWPLAAGALLLLAGLLLLQLREQRRQMLSLRRLALSLEEAVKRNRPMPYRVHEEGELGLLAHSVQELSLRLQESISRLHADKRFLKDTIADISHQLKTPLSSLIIYVDLLREGVAGPRETEEFLRTCRRELDRMEWLTLTLLKIARLEAGALEVQPRDAPLADTVEAACDSVRLLAEDRGVTVDVEPPDGPARAEPLPHDPRWLGEAIGNLVKNAVEHSPPGSRVTIGWTHTPVFCRLEVRDRGSGIDERDLPHIFKKFYRASSAGGSGVGLGLALAKSVVERHGGLLSAAPNPGGGTTFTVTLPLRRLPGEPPFLTIS